MKRVMVLATIAAWAHVVGAVDGDGNQQSDIWEMVFGVSGLPAAGDQDGDLLTNAGESGAGTNPLDPDSRPLVRLGFTNGVFRAEWDSVAGKRYDLLQREQPGVGGWEALAGMTGSGGVNGLDMSPTSAVRILRLEVSDLDSDDDGLTDAEENWVGFNPASAHTDRRDAEDLTRLRAAMSETSTFTLAVLDGNIREDWPDGAIIAVRRATGVKPLRVNFTLGGTATAGADYTASATGELFVPAGAREA